MYIHVLVFSFVQKFQALEEDHLKCMRGFLSHVSDSHKSCDMSLYKEYKQLTEKMDSFQVDKLINMFAQIKGTGRIKPSGCVH